MMEPSSSPLSGALGYALIGEIIGVTALSLTAIGMMLKRLRNASENEMAPVEATFRLEDSPEYIALMGKVEQLEGERKKREEEKVSNPDVEQMRKTIAYLENKLLEYEIVQEEISTLGELKMENEKLKVELNSLRASAPTEELIKKQFSEFSDATSEPKKESMPEDIQTLLSDIESLSKNKETKP